jgi:uncharacterized membrane protein
MERRDNVCLGATGSMTIDVSPNAAAFLWSSNAAIAIFGIRAWRTGQTGVVLGAAFTMALTAAYAATYLLHGENLSRFEVGTAAVPGVTVVALIYGLDGIGLPRALAARCGVGLHDPRGDFYERLRVTSLEIEREMQAARASAHDRSGHIRKASSLVERLAGLDAPTPEWAELRDAFVRAQRAWVELAGRYRDPERWPALPQGYSVLKARFGLLGVEIAASYGVDLLELARRRRTTIRLCAAAAVIVAIPGAIVTLSSYPIENGWLWLELSALFWCLLGIFGLAVATFGRLAKPRAG